jgi:hypothetical protein
MVRQRGRNVARYAAATRSSRTIHAVALLLLVAGCGRGGGGAADDRGPGGGAAAPVVVFVRSGGFAGTHDEVTVNPSGVATVTGSVGAPPRTRTLTTAELAELRAALDLARIATLERDYLDRSAADAYQYAVTYQGVTVTADETVVPAALRPAVDLLSRLLAP